MWRVGTRGDTDLVTRTLAGLLILLALLGRNGNAQEATCAVVQKPSNRFNNYRLPSGQYNQFWGGGGITMHCPSRGITLVADSVEQYGDERRVFMLGSVSYREPRLSVRADYLTYFLADERVVAAGNVVATLPSGSALRGPQAEYRRAVPRIRTIAELYSIGRPTVTIVQPPDRTRTPPPKGRTAAGPTTVTANVLFMRGDSLLYASGQVDIVRTDFGARGDSVFMNTATEYMRLMREPAIVGRRGRPFTLTGNLIDVYSRQRALERVLSRGDARAVSEDLTLVSDTIELRVADDLLQSAYAWGDTRQAEAVSQTQRITADSISVQMPQQRVRTMSALGKAYAEADPDTVAFRTTQKDWLRGDTIIAHFDSARTGAGDSAQAQIRELLAVVDARSYQHTAPRDTSLRCPVINYVRGDSILVAFDSGTVRRVRVIRDSLASGGILAEPDSTCGRTTPAPAAGTPATPAAGRPISSVSPGAGVPSGPRRVPPRGNSAVPAPALPSEGRDHRREDSRTLRP